MIKTLIVLLLLCGGVFAQQPQKPEQKAKESISIPAEQMKVLKSAYGSWRDAEFVFDSASRLLVDKSDCNKQVLLILTLDRDAKRAHWESMKSTAWREFDAPKGFILDLDKSEFRPPTKD